MSLDFQEMMAEKERLADKGQTDWMNKFVRMPEGEGNVVVRILGPAAPGKFDRPKNPLYCATRLHKLNDKSIHCLRTLTGNRWVGECLLCKYYSDLWRQGEEAGAAGNKDEQTRLQAMSRAVKPVERYYYNVIVRKEFDPKTQQTLVNVGPKILSIGKKVHGKILTSILGDEVSGDEPLGDVTHALTGRDFRIVKKMVQSGADLWPNYDSSKFLDPSPLGTPEEVENWLANLHDLVSLRHLKSEDEIKKELRIHLGYEKDESTTFNLNDVLGVVQPEVTVTETVTEVVTNVEPAKEVITSTTAVADEEESLSDDDFMKGLLDK